MSRPFVSKICAAAWLLVLVSALQSTGAVGPSTVAAQQRASSYDVSSKLVKLGPGYHSLRGHVYPRRSGVTIVMDRRSCSTCGWTSVAKTPTRANGFFEFRIDAPPAASVNYRVHVSGSLTARPSYSGTHRVDALPASTNARLKYWGDPVWRDEFNGAQVDTTKWRVLDKDRVSYDAASLYKSQATTRDGKLVLTAKRVDPAKDMFGRSWASAYLDTRGGRFSQRYGRWEILARVPIRRWESRGLWPSFWLRDDSGPGEVDVMEAWGTPSAKPKEEDPGNFTWSVHSDTMGGGTSVKSWALDDAAPSIARGWYRYACEWTPAGVRLLVDDHEVGFVSRAQYPWLDTAFPTKANIRLQFAVGSSYWGLPDASTASPAEFEIEYVRVWKYPGA